MKKTSLFLGLLLLIINIVSAQEKHNYGFFLGCGINWMKLDKSFYYDDSEVDMTNEVIHFPDTTIVHTISAQYLEVNDAKIKPTASFMIGGFYEYQTSGLFGLQFELMYNQYGYKMTGTVEKENVSSEGSTIYNYKSTTKLSNISAAILARFHLLNQHLSIDLGVQPSVCLKDVKNANRSIGSKEVHYQSGTDYKPFNLSIVGGVTGCIGRHLLVGARYNFGLLDVLYAKSVYLNKDEDTETLKYLYSKAESKTSSVQITVGYKF